MAIDRTEAQRRGQSAAKTTTKHPFIAIDHRIIDSPAFADLKPSAQALIMFIARQLKKDNNGHLQATYSWCQRFGMGSENTLRDSIAQLISHGFLYRTRSHGANGAWARYALTWLPITKKEDLFLAGFKPFAFRDWVQIIKKTTPQKVMEQSSRKCSFTTKHPAETAGSHPSKTADYESCCHVGVEEAHEQRVNRARKQLISPLAIRLSLTADRGHLRLVA